LSVSYPKAEILQRLIAVFLRHHAFTPGNERAEARALWEQAAADGPHPLPAFDEVMKKKSAEYSKLQELSSWSQARSIPLNTRMCCGILSYLNHGL